MFNLIIEDFVKNPYFVLEIVAMSDYFESDFAEEFTFELIDKSEIIYDFYS